jgi:hypothetical protein
MPGSSHHEERWRRKAAQKEKQPAISHTAATANSAIERMPDSTPPVIR